MTKVLDQASSVLLEPPTANSVGTVVADLSFEARAEFDRLMESWEWSIEGYLDAGVDIAPRIHEVVPLFFALAAGCLPVRFHGRAEIALCEDVMIALTWQSEDGENLTVAYDTEDEIGCYFVGHKDHLGEFETVYADTLSADGWQVPCRILEARF